MIIKSLIASSQMENKLNTFEVGTMRIFVWISLLDYISYFWGKPRQELLERF